MGVPGRRSARTLLCLAVLATTATVAATTACSTGGPPPLVTSQVAETSTPPATANELTVGVGGVSTMEPRRLDDWGLSELKAK